MAETTWTLGSLLNWTATHLGQKGVEAARLDAEVLLAHAAGCKRIDLYGMRFAEEASGDVRARYRDLVKKRLEGCPVAYLIGKKEFRGLDFSVGPAVLIPRPDTEVLLDEVLAEAKKRGSVRIVDVGTGSGCLPVALAKALPQASLTAIDVSPDALAVARANAEKHGVADRITFVPSDLFAGLAPDATFDCVISNPPYIATGDLDGLPEGVRKYEPRLALDGGAEGFDVFDRLIDAARARIVPGGWLMVEIGSPQEKRARERIGAFAEYRLAPTVFDHSGHPRVLKAQRLP